MRLGCVLAVLCLAVAPAMAGARLELTIVGDRIEAEVADIAVPAAGAPVFLRDVATGRRAPALSVAAQRFHATFDLLTQPHDGKAHDFAIDVGDAEVARATLAMPVEPENSWLRWMVIIGPLMGLAMIAFVIRQLRRSQRAT